MMPDERRRRRRIPIARVVGKDAEQIAVVSNGGWLKHWRLMAHFADTFDTADWWLARDMFAEWHDKPEFLPEFKELRRRQAKAKKA